MSAWLPTEGGNNWLACGLYSRYDRTKTEFGVPTSSRQRIRLSALYYEYFAAVKKKSPEDEVHPPGREEVIRKKSREAKRLS